jgi:hypothetical protein
MASGRLGATETAATTNTSLYIPPSSTMASCVLKAVNRSASTRDIRVAIVDGVVGAIADEDYITYGMTLAVTGDDDDKDKYEETGIVLGPTDRLVVYASGIDVSWVVMGIEEPA